MDTFKELNNYTLLKADCTNYVTDTYLVNNNYAIAQDDESDDWMLIEYSYASNEFGEVECITESLESLLIYAKEFIG